MLCCIWEGGRSTGKRPKAANECTELRWLLLPLPLLLLWWWLYLTPWDLLYCLRWLSCLWRWLSLRWWWRWPWRDLEPGDMDPSEDDDDERDDDDPDDDLDEEDDDAEDDRDEDFLRLGESSSPACGFWEEQP